MDINFTITKKQQAFLEATQDEVLYGGAAGGGKSYGQLIDAFLFAMKYKSSKQLILRRTFPELQRSLILTSYTLYPKGICAYNSSQHKYTFKNGSTIEFGYLENDKSVQIYQSAEYDVIRFDELTHFTEFQYTYMQSRLRGVNGYPKQIKCSTNPGSEGHAWVKGRFIEDKIPQKIYTDKIGRTSIFIPAKVQENKFLMQADPTYIKRLEQLPEAQRKALLHGEWEIFEGQVFQEWSREKHVIKPFKIPTHWKRFCSIDWGFNDPCAILWYAVDQDSRIYVYREYYKNKTIASDVAKKQVALSKGEIISYTVGSPDMWQKRGMDSMMGESIAEAFLANDILVVKADNDRLNGWQRCHEYLADAPDGKPYVQVFENCTNLIRTLPGLVYDDKKVEDVSDTCEDHAPESFRYGLMSRPSPNEVEKVKVNILPDALRTDDVYEGVYF